MERRGLVLHSHTKDWIGLQWRGEPWNVMQRLGSLPAHNGGEGKGLERSGQEWSGLVLHPDTLDGKGVEWNGVEWSGAERLGSSFQECER